MATNPTANFPNSPPNLRTNYVTEAATATPEAAGGSDVSRPAGAMDRTNAEVNAIAGFVTLLAETVDGLTLGTDPISVQDAIALNVLDADGQPFLRNEDGAILVDAGGLDAAGVDARINAQKGATNGVAPLVSGTVPAAFLPSYVDDALEAASFAALPMPGESGKIYTTLDTNRVYRWTGSTYVEISAGASNYDQLADGTAAHAFTTALRNRIAGLNSAREYGVMPTNTAAANKAALVLALVAISAAGGGVLDCHEPCPISPGIVIPDNVSLRGNNLSAFKGSLPQKTVGNPTGAPGTSALPSGAAWIVSETTDNLFKLGTNTAITGFVLHYVQPFGTATHLSDYTVYPTCIVQGSGYAFSISLERLCFVGSTSNIDLGNSVSSPCEDLSIDRCYGYPLGGTHIRVRWCFDIPRITNCHVNHASGSNYLGNVDNGGCVQPGTRDDIASSDVPAYWFESVDDIQCANLFAYAVGKGFYLKDTYGYINGCSVDCCKVAYHYDASPNGNVKEFTLVSPNAIVCTGPRSSRVGFLFTGDGGTLKLIAPHVIQNTPGASWFASSGTTGARAVVSLAGTGSQQLIVVGATKREFAGPFDYDILKSNGSATVSQADNLLAVSSGSPFAVSFATNAPVTTTDDGQALVGNMGLQGQGNGYGYAASAGVKVKAVPRGIVATVGVKVLGAPANTTLDFTHCSDSVNGANATNEYILRFVATGGGVNAQLYKITSGAAALAAQAATTMLATDNRQFRYTVNAAGTVHTLLDLSNNATIWTYNDPSPLAAGQFGFRADGGTQAIQYGAVSVAANP